METAREETIVDKDFFSPVIRTVLFFLIFAAGFFVRFYHIKDPPLDFAPTCQFRSASIARALFYKNNPDIPEWQKEIAFAEKKYHGPLEPAIMEHLALFSYKIAGKEVLWIPRVFAVFFWMIGGFFLLLLTRKLVSADGALFAVAFYVCSPFGIFASRSFQPDPLMIMGFMAAVYFIVLYFERPSYRRLWISASITAVGIFFKLITVFPIVLVFLFAGLKKFGFRRLIIDGKTWIFAGIAAIPTAVYYPYHLFLAKDMSAGGYFFPGFILKSFFWDGWKYLLDRVIGLFPLYLALIGAFFFKKRMARSVSLGLWMGYILYALVFTYPTYTHAYYHLQLIPIVAFSLAPLGGLLLNGLRKNMRSWAARALPLIIIFYPFFSSLGQARKVLNNPNNHMMVRTAREIGRAVNHSNRTIFLSDFYGYWLIYYGRIFGKNWSTIWHDQAVVARGGTLLPPLKKLKRMISFNESEYFIVTYMEEFKRQTELREVLFNRYPVVEQTSRYIVFDLTRTKSYGP
ncbi:MAG: glycosyltransferase family 39 protein [Candidatus Aminicenantes bacterium]|nr:glycosyltransferase family 39 protein [Candidatus Aminicenantes bacterium]